MPACTFPVRAAVIVAVGVVFGGCVSEADRREASRLRRPAMPTVGMEPGVAPVVKSEDAILAATLRHAEARDFAAARKVLETVADQGARERLAREVAAGLAAADPLAATAWALALSPGLVQTAALEIAARAMAKRDADNAIRWALEFSAPAAAGIVRRAVADELVVADPQATVRRLLVLPRAAARDELLGFAAAAWARHDVSGVETWLRELPDCLIWDVLSVC